MEVLKFLWEDSNVSLEGVSIFGKYTQNIDRDQAVDDDCKAYYELYRITDDDGTVYEFTAREIEAFAKTW